MAAKIKINETGDCIYTEADVIELLYNNPDLDISKLFFDDTSQYNKSLKELGIDLPIIHTGCDTYASIYPEFKHFNMLKDVDEVVEHLVSLTPNGK